MIYLLEDDDSIRKLVVYALKSQGYEAEGFERPSAFWRALEEHTPDLILLDIMLPEEDGISVLRRLKGSRESAQLPVIMLTARSSEYDKVEGLDAGADDYLSKPFQTKELLARIRAMLRRRSAIVPDLLRFSNLELNRATMELRCGNRSAKLANKAFQLMELLMERPRAVYSAEQLMEHIWGWDSESEINVVWVNISSLRKKLTELGARVEIRAKRGQGYFLEEKP